MEQAGGPVSGPGHLPASQAGAAGFQGWLLWAPVWKQTDAKRRKKTLLYSPASRIIEACFHASAVFLEHWESRFIAV